MLPVMVVTRAQLVRLVRLTCQNMGSLKPLEPIATTNFPERLGRYAGEHSTWANSVILSCPGSF